MRHSGTILVLAAACGGIPDHGAPPALDGPLLSFDSAAVSHSNAALLPAGFSSPQRTVCAPDVTRGFLAEILDHSLDSAQVQYEWAPMVPGPTAAHPTVGQPGFLLSGTIKTTNLSDLDLRPTHPFSFDRNWDNTVDAPYKPFVQNRPTDDPSSIHTEIETALFPEDAFGFSPAPGDRVLTAGSWIFDCGHPPYEAEIHPAAFVALARTDGNATISVAFANPYRVTGLFGPASLMTAFSHTARFDANGVAPFLGRLKSEILAAAVSQLDRIEAHTLLEATRFDPVTWFVCTKDPKPSRSASLVYSYRFVARTGVTVTAARRASSGCLEFHAEMGTNYQPATPVLTDQPWAWADINREAASQAGTAVDVRQMIINELANAGVTGDVPALHADTPPIIAKFSPLLPRAGADKDGPTSIIEKADDQPFPFYGRVRVYWK